MDLAVAADDRTGAFEVAGRLADAGGGPVITTVWPDLPGATGVVDLGSRHLSPGDAHDRSAALAPVGRCGHKIDSALRGNWADELAGRAAPVLLVPALPEQGRICDRGVVLEHGRPVHDGAAGTDVRRRITTSRPAESLRAAGARVVVEIGDDAGLVAWLAAPDGIAVVDARSDDEIAVIVDRWRNGSDEVVLAGPSVVFATSGDQVAPPFPRRPGPVLVVCGSVHPVARAQLEFVERRGVTVTSIADPISARRLVDDAVLVLATEIPVGDVTAPMAVAASAGLARGVADLRAQVDLAAIVVIGGDTAAAVIGDAPATVHGSLLPGTPWLTVGDDPLPFVTRSGGFGSEAGLDDLIRNLVRR
jgi:uncharacterized protein YgbK (DUF1537 family)